MPGIHIVVLSGGVGARMGTGSPKQFLLLGGRPVLLHSLAVFATLERVESIHLVCPANYIEETRKILAHEDYRDRIQLLPGGADRHESTVAGLAAVLQLARTEDLVLIHDAARPLVEREEVERLIDAFFEAPADLELASLAAPITETIVEADALPGALSRTVDRTRYFAVKTPQAARVGVLRRMLERDAASANPSASPAYTDLLTWGEAHGIQGGLVAAGPRNHKLTHPGDLPWLASLLADSDR